MMATENLVGVWDSCYDKENGWFPSLERGLQGVTAAQATWRTDGKHMNTIRELVSHMLFYKMTLLSGLTGSGDAPAADTSFQANAGTVTEQEWRDLTAQFKQVHTRIREKLVTMSERDWQNEVDGVAISQWVADLAFHDVYHTGQIIFIRKLQGSWAA